MRPSVVLVLLLGAAAVAAVAAGDAPGSLNAAAEQPAAAPQQPNAEPSKPVEQPAPQQPAQAPQQPAQAPQQPTANGGGASWGALSFFSQRFAQEEAKQQQQKQQAVPQEEQEQPVLRPLREQEQPTAGLQRQAADLGAPLGLTSYLNGGYRPRSGYYEQPRYGGYREEQHEEDKYYARDHYEPEPRPQYRRYEEHEDEHRYRPSYGRRYEEHEERHGYGYRPHHEERRYYEEERHHEEARHNGRQPEHHEPSEQERIDKLTKKRLAVLTPEEQKALEEFYKKKFGADEAPKKDAPKKAAEPEAPAKKVLKGNKKAEEDYTYPGEAKKGESKKDAKYEAPADKDSKFEEEKKYEDKYAEEKYEAPVKHYREEHEYHHYRNTTGYGSGANSIFHMFHNDGYYGDDEDRDGYYRDGRDGYYGDEDEERDYLDGYLYMPGPEGTFGSYASVQAVEEFSDDHIDAAICLHDKAAGYAPANNTDPVKPTSITTELTCCDGKLAHKREHLRRMGMPVVNGVDEVTVASCSWSIAYFATAIPAYDDIFAVGSANVSCAFNGAAHLCGKIPGDLELVGQGLVYAVPAKMQKRIERRPRASYGGGYSYGGYGDDIDTTFHRTKVVVSPAAGAAQVASAEEPAYSKYEDKYEEEYEHHYDEYDREPLGPLVLGNSLIAKIPLGKDTHYGVKLGGVLEYTINFWNDQVAVLPNSPPLAANTTATMRPHKEHRLVKPGKYWLMLDQDYGHAYYGGH